METKKLNEKNKIKVLHYVPGFDFGGIESRLLDWYKNVDRDKVKFDLLVQTNIEKNELINEFIDIGGDVFVLPGFSPRTYIKHKKKLKDFFLENSDYDVIHCHSTIGYFVLKEAKKTGIPLRIMHSRTTNFNPGEKQVLLRKILQRISPFYANHYFACSKEAGEWVFSKRITESNRFRVIDNGIEASKFIYDQKIRDELRTELGIKDEFVIGNVARFSTAKNHNFLIEVFYEILKAHQNSKLLLIGDGPTEYETREQTKKLGIEDKVFFIGRKKNVEDYMQCMDVFLFPSHFEGFGTVAVEAQAAGLHCIVSSGVPHSVDITDLVEHLALSEGINYWADKVLRYVDGYERKNMYQQISDAGFDVITTAKWLETFYINNGSSFDKVK